MSLDGNVTINDNGTLTIPYNGGQALFIPENGLTGFNRYYLKFILFHYPVHPS
jgi:hypothetical protein